MSEDETSNSRRVLQPSNNWGGVHSCAHAPPAVAKDPLEKHTPAIFDIPYPISPPTRAPAGVLRQCFGTEKGILKDKFLIEMNFQQASNRPSEIVLQQVEAVPPTRVSRTVRVRK